MKDVKKRKLQTIDSGFGQIDPKVSSSRDQKSKKPSSKKPVHHRWSFVMIVTIILLAVISIGIVGYFIFRGGSESNDLHENSNINIDTDGDELTDMDEAEHGTNPTDSDTDGDGYEDKPEVDSGYNPLEKP
ncbi:hypothetical protein ACFL2D_02205 [Patescibacteria group bacterium]